MPLKLNLAIQILGRIIVYQIPLQMKFTPYKVAKLEAEVKKIRGALDMTNGKVGEAANLLQIDRKTIYNKLKIYNEWIDIQSRMKALPKAKAPQ